MAQRAGTSATMGMPKSTAAIFLPGEEKCSLGCYMALAQTRVMDTSILIMDWLILQPRTSVDPTGMPKTCALFLSGVANAFPQFPQMQFMQQTTQSGEKLPVPLTETAAQSSKLPVLSAQDGKTLQKIQLTDGSKVPKVNQICLNCFSLLFFKGSNSGEVEPEKCSSMAL